MRQLATENNLGQVPLKFFTEEGELVKSIQDLISQENISLIVKGTSSIFMSPIH